VHVDELNDEFDWNIPEDEDYETIGGFAFSQLGHIPQNGETFSYNYLQFTIIEVEQRKITRLKIFVNQELQDAGKSNGKKKSGDESKTDEK
jgi:CBS domain containing-hemolysin-like protein